MSRGTVLKAIEFVRSHSHTTDPISISFYGGEALLELDMIVFIMNELNKTFGNRVSYDVSTNGLLLTDNVVQTLLRYNADISVSLDGCKSIHDKNRKTIAGHPTFDTIVTNLKRFKASNPTEYNKRIRLLVTIGSLEDIITINQHAEQFKELLGEKQPFLSHILPNFNTGELYIDKPELQHEVFDIAARKKRNGIKDFYTLVYDDLLRLARRKHPSTDSGTNNNIYTCLDNMYTIFIDAKGRLKPCEKAGDKFVIGNVQNGIDLKMLRKWTFLYTLRRTLMCKQCNIIDYCSKCLTNMNYTIDEQKSICEIYKKNIELALQYQNDIDYV